MPRRSLWFLLVLGAVHSLATAQTTTRVSVSSAGEQQNGSSYYAAIALDGRFVVFTSTSSNLVVGDTNDSWDVFVHDRVTHVTERGSVDSTRTQGDRNSTGAGISADGRFVAFTSDATNLVPGDTSALPDVFVHDRSTGTTVRASVDPAGGQVVNENIGSLISGNGQFVLFTSGSSAFVLPPIPSGQRHVYLHDLATGVNERISVNSAGEPGDGPSDPEWITPDGRFVAFRSTARNLSSGAGIEWEAYVRDRVAGTTERVSIHLDSSIFHHGDSIPGSLSSDGRFVALYSDAGNLVLNDNNAHGDCFVFDRMTNSTERVSVSTAGAEGNNHSSGPSISLDGRWVSFTSRAANLVTGDTNGMVDAFVHDRWTHTTIRVSLNSAGVQGDDSTTSTDMNSDGSLVMFASQATNFVVSDTNGFPDVFVRDLRGAAACLLGTVNAGTGAVASVLTINGSPGDVRGVVQLGRGASVGVSLAASPSGPGGPSNRVARYVLWAWQGYPSNPLDMLVRGRVLGCTVNPTPLIPMATPQPLWCLRGAGVSSSVCGAAHEIAAPSRAPWTRTHPGFFTPIVLTMQGVLQDNGAANPFGYSVTNAVVLSVQ